MEEAFQHLQAMAVNLESVCQAEYGEDRSQLRVSRDTDGLVVHWLLNEDAHFAEFEGEEIFPQIFRVLGSPEIGPYLKSLTLQGAQIAANGTIDWPLEPIVYAEKPFARLKSFCIDCCGSAGTLEGKDWNDRSAATRLLDRMPALEVLEIPQPPHEDAFFDGASHPLRILSVLDVDLDGFIPRLAASNRFARLEKATFVESCRNDVNPRVSASDYLRFMQSEHFPELRSLSLGEVGLSDEEAMLLDFTRIGRQLCSLDVSQASPWCDREMARAAPESMDSLRAICDQGVEPVEVLDAWLTPAVRSIATGIRANEDWSLMPVLADALEDAGCANAEFLTHCRIQGRHVAGCFVIRLLTVEDD